MDSAMPPSLLCRLGGVHRQLSCCSEMWRLLLRDRETSVPGPRGKKKKERKREQGGKREREAGGKDLAAATSPSSLGTSEFR